MNQDEILKMQAGREMDTLVAETFDLVENKNTVLEFYHPFSTNIESAFCLMQEIGKRGWLWQLQNAENGRANNYHCFIFVDDVYYRGHADTLPLAICRAALLAVVPVQQGGV